jgi:hypothetical protein
MAFDEQNPPAGATTVAPAAPVARSRRGTFGVIYE